MSTIVHNEKKKASMRAIDSWLVICIITMSSIPSTIRIATNILFLTPLIFVEYKLSKVIWSFPVKLIFIYGNRIKTSIISNILRTPGALNWNSIAWHIDFNIVSNVRIEEFDCSTLFKKDNENTKGYFSINSIKIKSKANSIIDEIAWLLILRAPDNIFIHMKERNKWIKAHVMFSFLHFSLIAEYIFGLIMSLL